MGLISRVSSRTYRKNFIFSISKKPNFYREKWSTSPNLDEPTVRLPANTKNTKSPNTKRVKNLPFARFDDDITENNPVMVVKPNLSFTRRLRPLRIVLASTCYVLKAFINNDYCCK